jgi:hypothetical protein
MDRTSVVLTCPGSSSNYTVIANTPQVVQWGVGHPANTGSCTLFLMGLDGNGNPMDDGVNYFPLTLNPGASFKWYWPPSGAAAIIAVCSSDCNVSGTAVLEYDTPNA